MPDRPRLPGMSIRETIVRAQRLRVILNQIKPVLVSDSHERLHIRALPEKMNGDDRLGLAGNRALYQGRVNRECSRVHIHPNRDQPQQGDHLGRRHIGKGRDYHLVARAQVERHQSNL